MAVDYTTYQQTFLHLRSIDAEHTSVFIMTFNNLPGYMPQIQDEHIDNSEFHFRLETHAKSTQKLHNA